MSNTETIDGVQLSILQNSLSQVQNAVRAYDVKAQIVSIGFIFSLGTIAKIGEMAPEDPANTTLYVLIFWVLAVVPIAMFGYVLYPSRSAAPKLGVKGLNLQRSYYLLEEQYPDLDSYLDAFDKSDWKLELAYEIQKNSLLRDLKRRRFVWALALSGLSFSLLFLIQLLRSVSFFS